MGEVSAERGLPDFGELSNESKALGWFRCEAQCSSTGTAEEIPLGDSGSGEGANGTGASGTFGECDRLIYFISKSLQR